MEEQVSVNPGSQTCATGLESFFSFSSNQGKDPLSLDRTPFRPGGVETRVETEHPCFPSFSVSLGK